MAEIILTTNNLFVMAQFVSAVRPDGLHIEPVFQDFTIAQSVTVVSTSPHVAQSLNFSQSVSVNKTIQLSTGNFIPFNTSGVRTKDFYIAHLLALTQVAKKVLPADAANVFSISQAALCVRGFENILNLQHTVNVNVVKLILVEQEFDLVQGAVALIDGNWQFTNVFTPTNIDDYDPSLLHLPPVPQAAIPVQLIGGPYSLTFANVDFGDSDSVEHTRISRRSRGNDLIIFRETFWPKTEIIKFKLIDLSYTQGQSILNFLTVNLAKQIKFSDWFGVRWIGVITNPEAELTQSTRDQACGTGRFEIELQFQGEQIGYTVPLEAEDQFVPESTLSGVVE